DALTGRGEEHLFDEVAHVLVLGRVGRAAASVEVRRIVELHHVPFTRTCVTTMVKGVPVGAQTDWLSCRRSGWPFDITRVAAVTHCAVTHGPLPAGGANAQPATV